MIKAVLRCNRWKANGVISYLTKDDVRLHVEIIKCKDCFDSYYTKITIKVTDNSVLNDVLYNLNKYGNNKPVLLMSKKRIWKV